MSHKKRVLVCFDVRSDTISHQIRLEGCENMTGLEKTLFVSALLDNLKAIHLAKLQTLLEAHKDNKK